MVLIKAFKILTFVILTFAVEGCGITLVAAPQSINAPVIAATNALDNGWSLVQVGLIAALGNNYPSRTGEFPQPTRGGDLLVAYCDNSGTGTLTMTDDAGNTYVPSNEGAFNWTAPWGESEIFYVLDSLPGATQFTVSDSPEGYWLFCNVAEFSNSTGVSPGVEPGTGAGFGDNISTGTGTSASVSITTIGNGDLIFQHIQSVTGIATSNGTGFISLDSFNNGAVFSQATAGLITMTATFSNGVYGMEGIAFKHP